MTTRPVKQVIVMRTDLEMRKGKMIAQGAHAAMMFMLRDNAVERTLRGPNRSGWNYFLKAWLTKPQQDWVNGVFTKICVRADSEEELLAVCAAAQIAGLTVHSVTDAGKTEFHGVPTLTCCAIGPNYADQIDAVTGHLKLL